MTSEERLNYVNFRIKSAFKTFDATRVLADNGFWNSAVNRLYYSVFYSVNALLIQNEISANSHSGMRSQFSLHFIKTGILDKKFGALLAELYDWRQKGDYDNIFDYDSESVRPLFDSVFEMITCIEKIIKKQIND
jgi:uncharacterized protein